ncbi:MAG: DUF2849 domain-containing protein [Pseudomonadota bacterium]
MKAITANHLTGGHVVFFASGGTWSKNMDDAALYTNDDAFDAAMKAAHLDQDRHYVVGVYEIDVELAAGGPRPQKLRERIRAEGPTTAYGDDVKPEFSKAA